MKTEKKIFLNKNEDLDVAVDHLIGADSHIVVLNIPRDSALSSSVNNFHVLKRESDTAGKELHVESVDEIILELASLARIKAFNPVFKKRERIISDILPKPRFKKEKVVMEAEAEEEAEAAEETEEIEEDEVRKIIPPAGFGEISKKNGRRRVFRRALSLVVVFLVVAGGFLLANRILPKATVEMILKKVPVTFAYGVVASSGNETPSISGGKVVLPAELLEAKGNLSLSFPASGREKVQVKAKGVLTIYNAYSSEPQALVATTRFLSLSGKLFRLDERVTVPGAKIVDGKVVPSKIDVSVTADEPGEESNVGPEKNWRIPGFKGDPRYEGFYADSVGTMSGGFVGERAVPTDEDVEKGKAKLFSDLESVLEAQILILLSDKFKVFPDAREFEILENQIEAGDADGNFRIFAEAQLRYLVFEEEMLELVIAAETEKTVSSGMRVREFSVDYGAPQVNLAGALMSFSAEGEVVFESNLDVEELKREFAGQNEEELRKAVFFLSGLERANISLWPFWVKKVPRNLEKVQIILN